MNQVTLRTTYNIPRNTSDGSLTAWNVPVDISYLEGDELLYVPSL